MVDSIVFDSPKGGLFAFVVFGFIFLFWHYRKYRRRMLSTFIDEKLLPNVLLSRSERLRVIKECILCVSLLVASIAVMQPKGNPHYLKEEKNSSVNQRFEDREFQEAQEESCIRRKAHEIIFLVDASASMEVEDMRLGKSRLEYAKEFVDDVIGLLDGQSVSLYAFTSEVTKIVPETVDYLYVRLLLRNIQVNEGDVAGTDFVEVLNSMHRQYFMDRIDKARTFVVLTDGGDTRLEALDGGEREEGVNQVLDKMVDAEFHDYRLFCVGLGTEEGRDVPRVNFEGKKVLSSLDEGFLRKLSHRGRGKYYFANDVSSLLLANKIMEELSIGDAYKDVVEKRIRKVHQEIEGAGSEPSYDLYFQLPLALAIISLVCVLLLPLVWERGKGVV